MEATESWRRVLAKKNEAVFKHHADLATKERPARILHALHERELHCGSFPNFSEAKCPLEEGSSFCFRSLNPGLDTSSLAAVVEPIIAEIREVTDPVGEPLLELNSPIPGLSDLAGSEITLLHIAKQKLITIESDKAFRWCGTF